MDQPKNNVIAFPKRTSVNLLATSSGEPPAADRSRPGDVSGATVRGRIELGERETFDDAICVRVGKRSADLVRVTGRLVLTTFDGVLEDVSFTPGDDEIDDVQIFPVASTRDGETLILRTKRSQWEFLIGCRS
jgi:hypothetical protein